MKALKTFKIPATLVALGLFLLLVAGCDWCEPCQDDSDRYRLELKVGEVEPKRVEGGKYPAIKPDLEGPLNEAEEDKPYYVPVGPIRGKMEPENPVYEPKQLDPDGNPGFGGMITFEDNHTALVQEGPRRISPLFIPMMQKVSNV